MRAHFKRIMVWNCVFSSKVLPAVFWTGKDITLGEEKCFCKTDADGKLGRFN